MERLQGVTKLLVIIFLVLFVLNIIAITIGTVTGHTSMQGVLDFFEFSEESSLATYFSSMNLLLASVLLFAIYKYYKRQKVNKHRSWFILSLAFLYMSIDEFVCIHELLVIPARDVLDFEALYRCMWIFPGAIICLIFALFFFSFFTKLPFRYKKLFAISVFVFIVGAFGVEAITYGFAFDEAGYLLYSLWATLEESMEMLGIIVFIYALIDYLKFQLQAGEFYKTFFDTSHNKSGAA